MSKRALFFAGFILIVSSLFGTPKKAVSHNHITFIENKGQWHPDVWFQTQMGGAALFLKENGYTVTLYDQKQYQHFFDKKRDPSIKADGEVDAHAFNVNFVNANENVAPYGLEKKEAYHNYFLGNNASQWTHHVALYEEIYYPNLYDGIDLKFYQNQSHSKYEFIVAPHVSPKSIVWEYEGAHRISLQQENLVVTTSVGKMIEMKPIAYQIINEVDTQFIDCHFSIKKGRVSFKTGHYDKNLPLILDPTLIFSSYTGSISDNWGFTASFDSEANVFAGGLAFGSQYPVTPGAFQVNFAEGQVDIVISKFNDTGTDLLYSTYLGGSCVEMPHSIIANYNDELYVFGTTGSEDFPVTEGCYQGTFQGGNNKQLSNGIRYSDGADMFILKFSADGSQLLGSTFMGGTFNDGLNTSTHIRKNYADEVRGEIILDNYSNVYVTSCTFSLDFPTTANAFQPNIGGGQDAVIFMMNHNLTNLTWSSYLGSSNNDAGYSMVVNPDETIFLCGGTKSPTFPVTPSALQPENGGGTTDGFVTKVSGDGTQILASTYLGKEGYDQAYLVKSDRDNNAYIFGQSDAPLESWVVNADWSQNNGQFICKIAPQLDSIVWSTEFGSNRDEPDISPTALLVDVCNKIYMSGWGGSVNGFGGTSGMPITPDAQQVSTDGADYYLICINDDASNIYYATYFGGISDEHVDGGTSRFDRKGRIYQAVCAGCGGNSDFPTTPSAWSNSNNSHNCNLAVFKMDFNLPAVVADFNMPVTICAPNTIEFDNRSQTVSDNTAFFWDFGDGNTSTEAFPAHEYIEPGLYAVMLVVSDLGTCNFSDTLIRHMLVLSNSTQTLPTQFLCDGSYVQLGFPPSPDDNISYEWTPTTGLSNSFISNPTANPDTSTRYTLLVSNGVCFDTIVQMVECVNIEVDIEEEYIVCAGESATIEPEVNTNIEGATFQWSDDFHFDNIINTNTNSPILTYTPYNDLTTLYFKVLLHGCEDIYTVTIHRIKLELTVESVVVACFVDTSTIHLNVNYPNCTFDWQPAEFIYSGANTASPCVQPPHTMDYTATVMSEHGCETSTTVEVVKQEGTFPIEVDAWASDQHIFLKESTILFSTDYQEDEYTYSWTPDDDLSDPDQMSTEAKPEVTTLYTVTITDKFGCQKSDTVTIYVTERICDEPYIYVPNAFSPNNDNINDILYVRSEIIESEIIFKIFDKWGELMFETTDISEGWNGTYKGEDCMPGVYDYYLEGKCYGVMKFMKKGNVTLIR